MIQIITGTFGYYNGRKVVVITSESGPQKFDPELETRLVENGTAKYVGASEGQHEETTNTFTGLPEYNDRMKLDELRKAASAYGVDASSMMKKSEIISAIEAAKVAGQQDDNDDGTGDEEPV